MIPQNFLSQQGIYGPFVAIRGDVTEFNSPLFRGTGFDRSTRSKEALVRLAPHRLGAPGELSTELVIPATESMKRSTRRNCFITAIASLPSSSVARFAGISGSA
ncbi:hypothetical protein J8I87_29790 [Paraburkholderia sp. LEh10]|nr:hypothetical protein [Paraburkholderia sp. LEh10]